MTPRRRGRPEPGLAGGNEPARRRAHDPALDRRREYRVDDLARAAGTTVRNVRAYQERGLLPPPRRSGRVALYSAAHLARLRLVVTLLERGYTLASIGELVRAVDRGEDVAAVLGLDATLAAPWAVREERWVRLADLVEALGRDVARALPDALDAGLLEPAGDGRYRVTNPAALDVGSLLVEAGVPLDEVLKAARRLGTDIDALAGRLVALVETHVVEPLGVPMPAKGLRQLEALVVRLRPLVTRVVEAELARAMEQEIRRRLGQHLERLAPVAARSAGRRSARGAGPRGG